MAIVSLVVYVLFHILYIRKNGKHNRCMGNKQTKNNRDLIHKAKRSLATASVNVSVNLTCPLIYGWFVNKVPGNYWGDIHSYDSACAACAMIEELKSTYFRPYKNYLHLMQLEWPTQVDGSVRYIFDLVMWNVFEYFVC